MVNRMFPFAGIDEALTSPGAPAPDRPEKDHSSPLGGSRAHKSAGAGTRTKVRTTVSTRISPRDSTIISTCVSTRISTRISTWIITRISTRSVLGPVHGPVPGTICSQLFPAATDWLVSSCSSASKDAEDVRQSQRDTTNSHPFFLDFLIPAASSV